MNDRVFLILLLSVGILLGAATITFIATGLTVLAIISASILLLEFIYVVALIYNTYSWLGGF